MNISLLVRSDDRRVEWVGGDRVDHINVVAGQAPGPLLKEVLVISSIAIGHDRFPDLASVVQPFGVYRARLIGQLASNEQFVVRNIRWVEGGSRVLISLRPAAEDHRALVASRSDAEQSESEFAHVLLVGR